MRQAIPLAVAMMFACATYSLATTGGPQLAQVLGWDPSTQRVYYLVEDDSGEVRPSELWYFALGDSAPWIPHRSRMIIAAEEDDPVELRSLMRRLQHLHPGRRLGCFVRTATTSAGKRSSPGGEALQFARQVATITSGDNSAVVRFVNYGDCPVEIGATYEGGAPSLPFTLVLLSFEGIPWEGGYEVQMPVLLTRSPAGVRDITWRHR